MGDERARVGDGAGRLGGRRLSTVWVLGAAAVLGCVAACASSPGRIGSADGRATAGGEPTVSSDRPGDSRLPAERVGSRTTVSVPLLIEGRPVGWSTLTPLLSEAAGPEVIDELALEAALRGELGRRGLSVDASMIEDERERWVGLLEREGVPAGSAEEIRRRRGLGEERFARLLWRNAALRALVDPAEIAVSAAEIGLAREIRTGRRFMVSGVVSSGADGALEIRRRMLSHPSGPMAGLFAGAEAAGRTLYHTVLSPADPAYPESMRRVLAGATPGTPTGVFAMDGGFGVALVHGVIEPADGGAGTDDAALRRELEIRKTRLAMERLARSLVERTPVSVMDRSLR